MKMLISVICLLLGCALTAGTRISGTLSYKYTTGINTDLFYLTKFGVAAHHPLYVFGAVGYTSQFIEIDSQMVLVLFPQTVTDELVASYQTSSCDDLFQQVLKESKYIDNCFNGTKDYVRQLPCIRKSAECNQPPSIPLISNESDFTYYVPSSPSTQYYYLFMLACNRNSTLDMICRWRETRQSDLRYDITLVNSDPEERNGPPNPFLYQFPYELEGILILHMVFSVAYFILLTVHFVIHTGLFKKACPKPEGHCKMHRLPALFTVSLFFEFVHVLLDLIHYGAYASNGYGAVWGKYLGEVANQVSDWLLILVLVLIGKGWMVTTCAIRWRKVTGGIWGAYVFFFTVYFVWTVVQEQVFPLSVWTDHTFQSWPGGLYLAYRLILLLYILYEMRHVYLVENRPEKLKLYFALAFLYVAWFSYLPFIVFVTAFINALLRFRVIATFLLTFDFLANLGMVVLFAPRWAQVLFQFDSYLNEIRDKRSHSYRGLKHYGTSHSGSFTNVI